MLARPMLSPILDDEVWTRELGDEEARILVEWLVEQAEYLGAILSEQEARVAIQRLYRRGRAIARFVRLWNQPRSRGGATQLAASEGFHWPLPSGGMDPGELMCKIVEAERFLLAG
jgi:hypothetical protein